jgi:zinc finger SWIM domain-containing protein 3
MSLSGAVIKVLVSQENVLKGVFYQSPDMITIFGLYPELVLIDATYKLNDLRMLLFLLLIVDGNGASEVVALWFVDKEDRETLKEMLRFFKTHNHKAGDIKVVMGDKDLTERDVIKEELPHAQLLICLYHTLRTFRREVTCEKLGVTSAERMAVLEILSKLVYAHSEQEYAGHYLALKDLKITSVLEYFEKNWAPIKEEWVEGFKSTFSSFNTRTNNRLESINQKLKKVITKCSSIVVFWRDVVICLRSLNVQRNHGAVTLLSHVPTSQIDNPALSQYRVYLMPYAYAHLEKQFKEHEKYAVHPENGTYVARKGNSSVENVCVDSCSCGFWTNMALPCCHMMACRKHNDIDVFAPDLGSQRWSRDYFLGHHRVFGIQNNESSTRVDANNNCIHVPRTCPDVSITRVLSQTEKYRKAFHVLQSIASVVAEKGMAEFKVKFEMLKLLESHMKNDVNFIIMEVPNETGKFKG